MIYNIWSLIVTYKEIIDGIFKEYNTICELNVFENLGRSVILFLEITGESFFG